jgi:hypothetical protein
MFWKNMLPPSSGLKSIPSRQPPRSKHTLVAISMLGLLSNSEDGGSTFLQNIGEILLDYPALFIALL